MTSEASDYVIVGAGAAGCVLANRLSADPACGLRCWRRAGRTGRRRSAYRPRSASCSDRLRLELPHHQAAELADRELYWPRGKTLGGSTSINAQTWLRGHRADYDGWASCPGWSYDEVLPYFRAPSAGWAATPAGCMAPPGPQFISELRDPNPTTSAFLAACAELGMAPARRAQRARQHRVRAHAGDPAPRAAAQRRGRLPAAGQAPPQPDRRHRGARPADPVRRDPCHRRGVPGCGRC